MSDLNDMHDDMAYLPLADTIAQRIAGWIGIAVICGFVAERVLRQAGLL
jgi:hypothetical protein